MNKYITNIPLMKQSIKNKYLLLLLTTTKNLLLFI